MAFRDKPLPAASMQVFPLPSLPSPLRNRIPIKEKIGGGRKPVSAVKSFPLPPDRQLEEVFAIKDEISS